MAVAAGELLAASTNASWSLRKWQMEDGLPNNIVTSLAQTPDGYLWVATPTHLARFDGNSFEIVPRELFAPGTRERTSMLLTGRDGGLWMALDHGPVVHSKSGAMQLFTNGLKNAVVQSLTEDAGGNLWITYRDGVACRLSHGKAELFGTGEGLLNGPVCSLAVDTGGQMCFAKGGEFGKFENGRFQSLFSLPGKPMATRLAPARDGGIWICTGSKLFKFHEHEKLKELGTFHPPGMELPVLLEDRNGGVWIGTSDKGLFYFAHNHFESVPTSYRQILCLLQDREGNIWAGTGGGGLDRIQRQAITLEGAETSLPFEAVQSMCQDTNGTLWAVTQNGLLVFRTNGLWKTFTNASLDGIAASCVTADAHGAIWIGTQQRSLYRLQNGAFTVWRARGNIRSRNVHCLLAGRNGDIWIGGSVPEIIERLHNGKFQNFQPSPDVNVIRAMAEDDSANIWAGTANGNLLKISNGRMTDESVAVMGKEISIRTLRVSSDGSLWMGFAGSGIGRYKDGHFFRASLDKGLFDNEISQILFDGRGWLWLGADHGIFKIRVREFDELAAGKINQLHCIVYGPNEGVPMLDANFGATPGALRSRDGRLWIPTRTALAVITPDQVRQDSQPPRVLLTKIIADDQTIAVYGNPMTVTNAVDLENPNVTFRLSPGHRRLQFEFTGINLTAPESVAFQYRLDGFDDHWIENGTLRSVSYTHLSTGTYRFRVRAGNRDGVWNETGASVAFEIEPFLWQQLWFRVAALILLISIVAVSVRYISLRRLRRRLRVVEQQAMVDRERARIAKDLHDDLGASMTRVTLLLELASQETGSRDAAAYVREGLDAAREAIKSLDAAVWAINPRSNTLPELIDYIGEFAMGFLKSANVRCILDLPAELPDRAVSPELRHNLFLIAKEALNNIIRHAQAGTVRLQINATGQSIVMQIEDDGCGFDTAPNNGADDGLRNMRQRAEQIGGRFEIHSKLGAGTRIAFEYFWPQPNSTSHS
ncbi:MAG: ATP-binding protein [Verrucomicrobia bacterium]|nr:ATP-binding protein [Verrucomicrobiota bacterium]